MLDVASWLQKLGLSKYAKVFADNEIDVDALPKLTQKDVEELGLPIGPRAKLLAAISELSGRDATASGGEGPEDGAAEAESAAQQAERRQLTVLFCDLVDSTRLANELDPEDLRAVMHMYQAACAKVIERYEGHVAQYLGDGIMAYFGWPSAQEDAAERAVRAGLEIVDAVKAFRVREPLAVRIGINTGVVVIGSSGSGDPSKPRGAVGETPHLAARLQSIAQPNTVLISEATNRLVSARFERENLGSRNLKGVAEAQQVFRVRRVREDTSRFQAARSAMLTPLAGRRAELALLQQRWQDAREGEGHAVFVSGVPGIGKSRMVHELEESISEDRKFRMNLQCLPHTVQSPLFPVIRQVERLANLAPGDSNETMLEKIERLIADVPGVIENAAQLLAELLSVPTETRYQPLGLTAPQIKSQTSLVLVQLLLGVAQKMPVLCVLEDAQWIDPSTQELLDLVLGRIDKASILVLVTHRPEYRLGSAPGNVSAMTLSRLGRREVTSMAKLLLQDPLATDDVMNRVIGESDYIPLFVEELARGAIEAARATDSAKGDGRAASVVTWSVPDTLRDSLVARLDRVPKARRVAQVAAVIGRDFAYEMLREIASLEVPELDSALEHLEESGVVYRVDSRPHPGYAFKHALLRDVAYESLLRTSRREIHAKAGAFIERTRPEIVATRPELLAYHFSLAEDTDRAVRYWIAGGKRARSRSANLEAIDQLRKALALLDSDVQARESVRVELEIQLLLGLCCVSVYGYSSDEVRKAFERACALSEQLQEPDMELQGIFGLWGHYWMRARHDRALELGETLLARAKALGSAASLVVGHRSIGSTLFTLGDFVGARLHLERAITLAQQSAIEDLTSAYAVDPRIAAQLVLAWNLWVLGYPVQALDHATRALSHADALNDPYSVAFAHYVLSVVRLMRGESNDALEHADKSLLISQENGINLYATYSRFGRGCAFAMLKQEKHALVDIRTGIEEAERSNLAYMRGFMLGWLAYVQLANDDREGALTTIDEAFKHVNDIAGRAWEAELLRLRGDILLAVQPEASTSVEAIYLDAIAVAKHQQARSLELRAVASLAKLYRAEGRSAEARVLLQPILGWFKEGLDTSDLTAARALLSDLH